MSDNCVKSYSSWNAFFFFTSLFLDNQIIKGKQLYHKMWSSKSYILRIIDIYVFFTAMLITYIKGGTSAQIFLERGSAMTRATFVIFYQVLLTDIVIIPRWAIQAPGSL
jgi:hypothetical protein